MPDEGGFTYTEPKTLTILMPVRLNKDQAYKDTIGRAEDGVAARLGINPAKVKVEEIEFRGGERDSMIRLVIESIQVPTVDSTPTQAATQTVIEDFQCGGDITAARVIDVIP